MTGADKQDLRAGLEKLAYPPVDAEGYKDKPYALINDMAMAAEILLKRLNK